MSLLDCLCVQDLFDSLFECLLYLTALYLFGLWTLLVICLPASAYCYLTTAVSAIKELVCGLCTSVLLLTFLLGSFQYKPLQIHCGAA